MASLSAPGGKVLAQAAAHHLERTNSVDAVSVVGSVARGDAVDSSDIDLVVLSGVHRRRSQVESLLPSELRSDRLSFITFTPDRWVAEAREGSLFAHHVRSEGATLFDKTGEFARGLTLAAATEPDVRGEIRRQLHRVRLYREPERFNGQHLFPLAYLYAIGKAIAIARSFELGQPIFVKDLALQRLALHEPPIAGEVETVRRLQPFYDLTRSRPATLPFAHTGADAELRAAVRAVERLGGA